MPSTSFPEPTITVEIGGKPTDHTMFFGRLHELAELVQAYERTSEMDFDASTRAAVLDICLSPRDERGRRIDGEGVNLHQLSIPDAKAVLSWAKSHVTDFFLDRLENHLSTLQSNGDRLTAVGAFLNGSAGSVS